MSERIVASSSMRGHLVSLVAALFCCYQVYMQASPGSMVGELMSGLGIDLTGVGLLASSLGYAYLLVQFPAGKLLDCYGCRKLLPSAVALIACGSLLIAWADNFWIAALGRVFMGCGSAFAIVGSFLLASEWYAPCRFPLLVGLFEMAGMTGGISAATIMPILVDHLGWRMGMVVNALAGLVLAITAFLIICDGKSAQQVSRDDPSCHDLDTSLVRTVLLNALYGLCMFSMVNVFAMLWGLPFLETLYPSNHYEAGLGLASMYLFIAFGTLFSGWLAGVLNQCRVLMVAGAILTLINFVIILYVPLPLFLMMVLLSLFGFGSGFYGLAFLQSKRIAPGKKLGQIMAVINGSMLIGGIVLQPFVGWLLDRQLMPGQTLATEYFKLAFSPLVALLIVALFVAYLSGDPWVVRRRGI